MTSDLAAFASEEPSATAEDAVSLTQIAARKTSISWVEALACIQQICHAVITGEEGSLNESSIYLHQSGRVSIEPSGETSPEDAVRFFGDLLGTWLEGTPHPMALDTILLAAADSPPQYSSVAEFAAALKPYARPDRAQLVRAVYHRAGGASSATHSETALAEQALPAAAPPAEPVPAFQNSRSRTPFIVPEAAPTSTLFNHQASARLEQPAIAAPDRRSAKDVAQDIKQDIGRRIVGAFQALAERLRPLLGAALAFLSAIPNRLRPLAKPLSVFAVAAVALVALGVSGWLLVSTFTRPSAPATAPAATARAEAPTAKVAVAAPAPPAATAAARVAATPTATPPASAKPEASIAVRATPTVDRAPAAILPPPTPRRSTSIVLEPDRTAQRAARPSATTASARPAPTAPPSTPATTSPSGPPESAPAINLQAAAPPVPEILPSAVAIAAPAAVAPKYPELPPPATIYTSNDADVIPPVQTYPRYVESLGPDHPDSSPFQVVIDENGLVESAVLARYPTNMRQAVSGTLLLAAAKAWRFQPATKDGHPVKYRRIIWFSNQ